MQFSKDAVIEIPKKTLAYYWFMYTHEKKYINPIRYVLPNTTTFVFTKFMGGCYVFLERKWYTKLKSFLRKLRFFMRRMNKEA